MATPLMSRRQPEGGFTLIEMVLAAFVIAVGLLGLTMLQTMALRTSSSGSRMAKAVRLGDGLLDNIANEGRLRRLVSQFQDPNMATRLSATVYFRADFQRQNLYFDASDTLLGSNANADPTSGRPAGTVFTAIVTPVVRADAPTGIQGMDVKTFQVVVEYLEVPNPSNAAATFKRSATLTRTVGHASA